MFPYTVHNVVRIFSVGIGLLVLFIAFGPLVRRHPGGMQDASTKGAVQQAGIAVAAYVYDHADIVSTNNRMIAALLAGEAGGAVYLTPSSAWNDSNGNMIDAWGVPLIFERRNTNDVMIIRSCGPNRKDEVGLGDDIQVEVDISKWRVAGRKHSGQHGGD